MLIVWSNSSICSSFFAFYVQVAKDPVFVRDGADIYLDSHISFTDVNDPC